MASLTIETINEIILLSGTEKNNFKTFVETGTYLGETTLSMIDHFDKLYTIELSENLYNRFNGLDYDRNKIISLLGDSSEIIKNVIPDINEDVIFWLDGHFSSGETAQGKKDCPLVEEITHINELCKKSGIIIIDDLRLFGTNVAEDWSDITIESVIEPIKDRLIKSFEHGDRLVIYFN